MRSRRLGWWSPALVVGWACSVQERVVEELPASGGGQLAGASALAGMGGVGALPSASGTGGAMLQKPPISKGGTGGSSTFDCQAGNGGDSGDGQPALGGAPDDGVFGASGGAAGDQGSGGACGDHEPSCPWYAAFVSVKPLAELNQSDDDYASELFDDERTIYFVSRRVQGLGPELWTASRDDRFHAFRPPTSLSVLTPIGGSGFALAPDLQTIYLFSHGTLLRATRANVNEPFGMSEPFELPPSLQLVGMPFVAASGTLYLDAQVGADSGIYRLDTPNDAAAVPTLVMPEPGSGGAFSPTLSQDELTLYFASSRALQTRCATVLDADVWQATRASTAERFAHIRPLYELSTRRPESPSWLSADGCRLYFTRQSAHDDADLYVAEKAKPSCPPP